MEDVLIENEFLNSNSVYQSIYHLYHLILLEMVIDSESQSRQVVVTVPLSSNSEGGGPLGKRHLLWIHQWFSYASEFCGRRKVYNKRAHFYPYFAAIDPPALLHYAGW